MPVTHWTFLFGCLALAGVFPFAGFWSKDAILAAVEHEASGGQAMAWHQALYQGLYLVGMATAALTAIYAFRAFFLAFHGEERIPREAGHHAHESPPAMTGPLVLLAIGALAVGAYFQWTGDFLGPHGFLARTPSLAYAGMAAETAEGGFHWNVAITSTLTVLAGIVQK